MSQVQKFMETCSLFNLKVDRLNQLSFTDHVRTAKTGITISAKRDDEGHLNSSIERRGPSQESVEAFILTFRLFLQDNEPISIRRLSEHYSAGVVSSDLEGEFADIRKALNGYLDDVHEFRFKENDKILTRRDMMEMYLYGDLAHTNNRANRDRFIHWTRDIFSAEASFNEFIVIISRVLIALWWLRDLNKKALLELDGK